MQVKLHAPFTLGQLLPIFLLIVSVNSELKAQAIALGLGSRRSLNSDFYGYDMSTTVRGNVSCVSPDLISHLPSLKAKFLRYPSGSSANWWDWHEGWYVNSPFLPPWDANLTKVPNKLEDFKNLLNCTGATTIFDLNLLTSNVRDQIAMLKHADSLGIPVKYIELGNEFYLEGDGADDSVLILIKYPTSESYKDTANIWIDSIKKYFPDAKIAVQGVFEKDYQPRKVTWNETVLPNLHGSSAISLHYYFGSKGPDSTETPEQKMDVNMGDIPDWFYQPYKAWGMLRDKSLSKIPPGQEVWITEYNFSDQARPVHGTWASGLYTALHGMQLLQDDRIKHIGLHGVDGQAVFGAFFYDSHGYNFGLQAEANYVGPAIQPLTDPWGLNAYGHTMTMVGNAIDGKLYASKIDFDPNPQIAAVENGNTFYYDGLFGYLFNDSVQSQAIIINVTGNNQPLRTNILFPNGGTYEMRTATAGVLSLIAIASDVIISNMPALPLTLMVKPYSITRIIANSVPAPPPIAHITVNGNTSFCEGDSVELDAGAGYYAYEWSTGAVTQKIWVNKTDDYWVHSYAVQGGYYGSDTVHIQVNSHPKIPSITADNKKNFCSGGSVQLKLSATYSDSNVTYYWPLTGSSSSSITATASGDYSMIVTNPYGCSSVSNVLTVKVYPLPQPAVTAVGASSACAGVNVTLQATPGYSNYSWSNGTWGQSHIFTSSGSYYVTVTDTNGCHGISNSISVTIWDPVNPTITPIGATTYCEGAAGNYLITIPGYSYNWLKSNLVLAGATSQNYKPSASGNYKVKITDAHGCNKTSSSSIKVTVNKIPAASISIGGGTNICNGQTKTISANGGPGSIYKWKKNGTVLPLEITKTLVVSSSGNYNCTITNLLGCVATSNTITVTSNCKDDEQASAGKDISWHVYPNPAVNQIHMQLNLAQEQGSCMIEIRNLLGELVISKPHYYSNYTVATDLPLDPSLSNGVYFIILREETAVYRTQFMIEQP